MVKGVNVIILKTRKSLAVFIGISILSIAAFFFLAYHIADTHHITNDKIQIIVSNNSHLNSAKEDVIRSHLFAEETVYGELPITSNSSILSLRQAMFRIKHLKNIPLAPSLNQLNNLILATENRLKANTSKKITHYHRIFDTTINHINDLNYKQQSLMSSAIKQSDKKISTYLLLSLLNILLNASIFSY